MYAQKKPIENTHIVRERDRQRFREILALLSLAAPVGLFLLLFTWQNLEVIRLGRELNKLQSVRKQLLEDNKKLSLEIERLTFRGAVEEKAVALGFSRTPSSRIVRVAVAPSQPAKHEARSR